MIPDTGVFDGPHKITLKHFQTSQHSDQILIFVRSVRARQARASKAMASLSELYHNFHFTIFIFNNFARRHATARQQAGKLGFSAARFSVPGFPFMIFHSTLFLLHLFPLHVFPF